MCKAFEWKCVYVREKERLLKKKECGFVYFAIFGKERERTRSTLLKNFEIKIKHKTHRENK